MADSVTIACATGAGDFHTVKNLLDSGADPNIRSPEGMTPLAIAAFWGYDSIVQILIDMGTDINACNTGTLWTPLHCAAFQGHGKVVMLLMDNKPDLFRTDAQGRTAVDFASALDSIWAFFEVAGCKRTAKADLIRMNIIKKISTEESKSKHRHSFLHTFTRPGSAYVLNENMNDMRAAEMTAALTGGDVLAGMDCGQNESTSTKKILKHPLTIWNF
ncbi:unnamed protein product [Lymnaea stagnalis]|uniref:Uncharacterized protein n=1 Tax=Lymnaea stagnalis TaxID=6523 RepID=A0AAV2HFN1_LYMST